MSDLSYLQILKQFEELYPQASGDVLRAAARCETMMTRPAAALGSNIIDMRSRVAARRART